MPSLLATNDFPPKLGGIQSVLWEMWRRLPHHETTVLTTPYAGDDAWDRAQDFRVVRSRDKVLLPTPWVANHIRDLARETRADVIFVDPMLPLGAIGPRVASTAPYVVVAHGAEITGYGRMPPANLLSRRILRGAAAVLAFGNYPMAECVRAAGRPLTGAVIPPGVDTERFKPISVQTKAATRAKFGIAIDRPVVLGLSRLVPRKGFDVLIEAMAEFQSRAQLVIGGSGRDRDRLEKLAKERGVAVRFLGRVEDEDMPALFGSADIFAMLCRGDRWGGLEVEGFGIVFLEAAACGVPQIAGRSGGSHEAVADGESGIVVEPRDVEQVRSALRTLLDDDQLRAKMGTAARERAVSEFSYSRLVSQLVPMTHGHFEQLEEFGT